MKDYLRAHFDKVFNTCCFFVFLSFSLALFILFSPRVDKDFVCRHEIAQLKIVEHQKEELALACQRDKIAAIAACQAEEKQACDEKFERYKTTCDQLRCELCKTMRRR